MQLLKIRADGIPYERLSERVKPQKRLYPEREHYCRICSNSSRKGRRSALEKRYAADFSARDDIFFKPLLWLPPTKEIF